MGRKWGVGGRDCAPPGKRACLLLYPNLQYQAGYLNGWASGDQVPEAPKKLKDSQWLTVEFQRHPVAGAVVEVVVMMVVVVAVAVVSLNPHVLYMYWKKDLGGSHCYLGCTGEEVGEMRSCVEI